MSCHHFFFHAHYLHVQTERKEETHAAPLEEAPSKIESFDLTIPLNAAVRYVDLEGKSDGRSLRIIVQAMLPRSAIFVRGEAAMLEEMKQFAVRELQLTRVHAPDVEQTVDASSDAQIYAAWLKVSIRVTSLFGSLLFSFRICLGRRCGGRCSTTLRLRT